MLADHLPPITAKNPPFSAIKNTHRNDACFWRDCPKRVFCLVSNQKLTQLTGLLRYNEYISKSTGIEMFAGYTP
jgi:hypothetical protein